MEEHFPKEDERSSSAGQGGAGPIVGVIIIVLLLLAGALYYAYSIATSNASQDQLPLIPEGPPIKTSTTTAQ